jgi:hypothetical protein
MPKIKVRTLFLSDIHLGFRHARVRELNEFLHGVEAETIVLVGDIVDALSLARRAFWTPHHTQEVRTLLARQRAGIPRGLRATVAVRRSSAMIARVVARRQTSEAGDV